MRFKQLIILNDGFLCGMTGDGKRYLKTIHGWVRMENDAVVYERPDDFFAKFPEMKRKPDEAK